MDQKNWQKIQDLFEAALTLPEAERLPHLESECGGNARVLQAVTSLLQRHASPQHLSELVQEAAVNAVSEDPQDSGTRIGPWAIIKEIGKGGMGTVYLAERADQHYHQKVAIKLIAGAYVNDEILNRFMAERQILAKLEHQNIARLLDGGATDKGAHYLVMEYIEGLPVDEFCNQNQLSIKQRLTLFRKICAAVQFAHQNLIVHRDLKPSNILVDQKGEPHLLDFGIAKLLQNNDTEAPANLTRAGIRMFTPHYSSPEQIKGEAINTQSDVYSLGVVLFELLTGRRPYRRTEEDAYSLEKAVVETQASRPSNVMNQTTERYENLYQAGDNTGPLKWCGGLQAKQLKRLLAGDLDNILMKAMRKRPSHRYSSVAAFSEDIGNYLNSQPITARPTSFAYRSRKFASRHRLSTAVVACLTIAIIGFSITTWLQAKQITVERDAAQLAQGKAEAISNFLVNMFASVDPEQARGQEITVRKILDDSSEKLKLADNPLSATPEIEATIKYAIGDIYLRLGLLDRADDLLTAALAYYRSVPNPDQKDLFNTLFAVAELAGQHFDQQAKMQHLQEADKIASQLWGPDDTQSLAIEGAMASVLHMQGKLPEAHIKYQQSYDRHAQLLGNDHPDTIRAALSMGIINHWLGNYAEALNYYQRCLTNARRVLGERSILTLNCMASLGSVLESSGRYEEAEPVLKELIETSTIVLGKNNPSVLRSTHDYADTLRGLERYEEAEVLFLNTLQRRREALGEEHIETLQTEFKLARLYRLVGRYDQAQPLITHAIGNMSAQLGEDHPSTKDVQKELDALNLARGVQ